MNCANSNAAAHHQGSGTDTKYLLAICLAIRLGTVPLWHGPPLWAQPLAVQLQHTQLSQLQVAYIAAAHCLRWTCKTQDTVG